MIVVVGEMGGAEEAVRGAKKEPTLLLQHGHAQKRALA